MSTNNQGTALLVMDMQTAIASRLPQGSPLVANLQQTIAAARNAGIPVMYVRVVFRPGFPEVSAANKSFSALKQGGMPLTTADAVTEVMDELKPQEGEVVIMKRRISAFAGSDLEVLLRGMNIKHMVLTGIATSGVVLSTIREAADKDYEMTVLSDGCADSDQEVHDVLMNKVFPRQADVMTCAEWIGKIK